MFYYLQDHATAAVLFIHDNEYLVNNLKSGIFDCYTHTTNSTQIIAELKNHANKANNDTGIKIVSDGTQEFALDSFPDIANKQNLIKIRKIGFTAMFECAKQYRSKKAYGFYPTDPFVIERALSSPDRISEYATLMGISTQFAEQELQMIIDSIYIDQFRLFTICNLWKKHINQICTIEEMHEFLPKMKLSFGSPGIVNV